MRNGFRLLLLVAVVLSLAGCGSGRHGMLSSGPPPMDSVDQWNVLANHVADRINKELFHANHPGASVHVRQGCGTPDACQRSGTFPFDEGFHDLLTTQLVSFGIPVVTSSERADLTVEYKVQTVYRPSGHRAWTWPKPGMLIALAAGIVVLEDAPWEIIAAATAVDVFRANYQPSGHYEVIITTSMLDKTRYVMRFSDIYSIDNADFWQYRQAPPATEIRLTDSGGRQSTR